MIHSHRCDTGVICLTSKLFNIMANNNLSPQQLQELAQHVVAICMILGLELPIAQAPADVYPSATKAELAAAAGTTTRTLNRWLQPYQSQLSQLGISPKSK